MIVLERVGDGPGTRALAIKTQQGASPRYLTKNMLSGIIKDIAYDLNDVSARTLVTVRVAPPSSRTDPCARRAVPCSRAQRRPCDAPRLAASDPATLARSKRDDGDPPLHFSRLDVREVSSAAGLQPR